MKLNMLIFTFLLVVLCGCSKETNQMKTKIAIKGMSCDGCVNRVQTAVLAVEGVVDATVSLKKEEVTVVYDQTKTDETTLAQKIARDAGKIAILKNGQEFLPEVGVNEVCKIKITQLTVNNETIYACSDAAKCMNEAKALHKKKIEDKWKKMVYEGKKIYFCSALCKVVFAKNPEQFFATN